MFAPQYPDGLRLDIYSYKLEGGNNGQDLKEINLLNHYIGMRDLVERGLHRVQVDAVRASARSRCCSCARPCTARWRRSSTAVVLFCYFGAFSLWSFGYKLYQLRPRPGADGAGEGAAVHAADVRLQADRELRGVLVSGGGHVPAGGGGARRCFAAIVRRLARAAALGRRSPGGGRDMTGAPARGAARCRRATWQLAATLGRSRRARRPRRRRRSRRGSTRAAPGATIEVAAGTYAGDLVIDRPVRLVGHGRPLLVGSGAGSVVRIRAADVTIEGFDIDGRGGGDLGRDSSGIHVAAPRATIRDCRDRATRSSASTCARRTGSQVERCRDPRHPREERRRKGLRHPRLEHGRLRAHRQRDRRRARRLLHPVVAARRHPRQRRARPALRPALHVLRRQPVRGQRVRERRRRHGADVLAADRRSAATSSCTTAASPRSACCSRAATTSSRRTT